MNEKIPFINLKLVSKPALETSFEKKKSLANFPFKTLIHPRVKLPKPDPFATESVNQTPKSGSDILTLSVLTRSLSLALFHHHSCPNRLPPAAALLSDSS